MWCQGSGHGAEQPGTHGCARVGCSQHTQGAQAVPGSRRLPGKCPKGRDGQGCATALPGTLCPPAARGASPAPVLPGDCHWAAAALLSEFPQLQDSSTSLWGVGWMGKGTAVGVSLEHVVLFRGQILCWGITCCALLKDIPAGGACTSQAAPGRGVGLVML